ncbi:hypothetical protein MMC25_000281 [Agyrium rufum]|nr:hypothetical protein [Agyrium rufum]
MATDPTSIIVANELDFENQRLNRDRKRVFDHNHKWGLGVREATTRRAHEPWSKTNVLPVEGVKVVPIMPMSAARSRRSERHYNTQILKNRKHLLHKHKEPYSSDSSSASDDVQEASAAPAPDAEITYSFDAARGPSQGGEILNMAVNKAVERFENKVTEKLVKDEYDVVMDGVEHDGYVADEDDFELV